MANSLTEGCDCLGEIRYLDAPFADEHGAATTIAIAICLHEEDYGILWKHQDQHVGATEVRRSRRMVISSISTVGNYEYGFYWYFYLDGSMQLEVKLTGIMSTRALDDDEQSTYAPQIAPGLAAPVHQHLFCARLDLDIDGAANEVYEVDAVTAQSELGNAFAPQASLLASESAAQRFVDPARSRVWKIVNPNVTNPSTGGPVGYKLVPGATPTLLAQPDSSIAQRAAFATKNLWVTPYSPDERRAAGDYPNQHVGGDGLPRWTSADRSLTNRDIVVWHSFGVTHIPRPEDWPVMPVEYCGFQLIPVGFFEKNPALDLPAPDHCEH
jgi:primary-amine oxidase